MADSRVIFVHFSSLPGGIEVILPGIIEGLAEYSFSAFIIRPDIPGKPCVYQNLGIDIKYGSKNNLLAWLKLFLHAFRHRKCIFHVFNIGPVFLAVLRIAGVRALVYSIHGTRYWKNRVEKIILGFVWKVSLSGRFLVTSNTIFSGRVFSDEVCRRDDITLLYNPVDHMRFSPLKDKTRTAVPRKIIYCGRLDKGKNLEEWIRIASKILKQFPEVIFELYGEGPDYNKIRGLISELKLDASIILKGYTDKPETAIGEADIMMFLSRYESFGNVVVESILCGTPVITGDIPSMKEIFCDFPDFMVSLDANTDNAVLLKLSDLEHLNRLASSARQNFTERFNPAIHYNKLRKLYSTFQ